MQQAMQVFLEQLSAAASAHTKETARSVRTALSPEVVSNLSPEQHKATEAAIRKELQNFVWQVLCLFDNVGCRLPAGVLGYTILAELSDTDARAPLDIRVGDQDYSDTWLEFVDERDA